MFTQVNQHAVKIDCGLRGTPVKVGSEWIATRLTFTVPACNIGLNQKLLDGSDFDWKHYFEFGNWVGDTYHHFTVAVNQRNVLHLEEFWTVDGQSRSNAREYDLEEGQGVLKMILDSHKIASNPGKLYDEHILDPLVKHNVQQSFLKGV
jgi:hypothetical protein